jgi:3-hydroxyacyl-[acyl-carrier-protein] dehydratase
MVEKADDILTIEALDLSDGQVSARLGINKSSSIFSGHFPHQPVVPGACMVQLVKDVLCSTLNANIVLKKAPSIKFINMMTPDSNPPPYLLITYKLSDGADISVNAKITVGDVACFKLQAIYTEA